MSNEPLSRDEVVRRHQARPAMRETDLPVSFWPMLAPVFSSLLLFSGFVPCRAQTTIDFDPPQFAAGQRVQTVGIVTFPDSPAVIAPRDATFTPPNALESAQVCADPACATGAYMMRMHFSQLLSSLSMKVGNSGGQVLPLCVPEGNFCPVAARLEGFDVNGNAVADSGDIVVGNANNGPITTDVGITDASGRIANAILYMNKGTNHSDYGDPVPARIDHLTFTSTGVTTTNNNTPPSISITTPTPQQSFPYPYQVAFSGKASAPAGLSAFCTALNNTTPPPAGQCTQVGLLDPAGNFTLSIPPQSLAPGTNTLSAFVYDLANQNAVASVTFSVQAPPPPSIVIFEPTASYCLGGQVNSGVCSLTSASNIKMTGGGSIPGGLVAFCVGANEAAPPPQAQCNQTNQFFSNVPVPAGMLTPGQNMLDAYAYDRWGRLAAAHSPVVLPADPQIVAMEVTQGIQTTSIPLNTPGTPVPYSGVRLFAGGKTVVRVFANTAAGTLKNVAVWLLGTRDQFDAGVQNQLLGLLFPDNGSQTLTAGGTSVSLDQRADSNGAYVFTLPADWASGGGGSITLYAVFNPAGFDIPPVPTCSGCTANSEMTLTGVNFESINPITINPIAITWMDSTGPHSPNPDPSVVFEAAASISPLSTVGLTVLPYFGTFDISDLVSYAQSNGENRQWLSGQVLNRVSEVEDNDNPPGYLVGVIKSTDNHTSTDDLTDLGLETPHLYSWPPRLSEIAVVDEKRPLTSAAHEFFHQLDYYHAGLSCGASFPVVSWPPDDKGDIQGIGLDRHSGSGSVPGTYRIIAPGATTNNQLPEVFDFMSYCTNGTESVSWISVRNWNAWGSLFPDGVPPGCDPIVGCANAVIAETPVPANQETLEVKMSVDPAGNTTILSVAPGSGKRLISASNPTDHTGFSVVVRDAAGQVVSRTPVSPFASDRWMYFNAEVLAPHAAKVEIEHQGSVVAQQTRSAHAPTIALLSPTPGTLLNGNSPNLIQWQAQDLDGDRLLVRVEYSTDDGKNYRVLTAGATANQVSLPGSLFSRSHDARIRLRVNDGFNEGLAVSGRLQAAGSPPTVRILEPVAGIHTRNDVALNFVGQAFDDAGRPIDPAAMKWYDGDRFLGAGRKLTAFVREPGLHTIRLVAKDDDRKSSASVDINIDAVPPMFVGLKIPQTVDHDEDEVRLVVGSSIPGVVVVGDHGYPVEAKPRELKVAVPKSKDDLTLRLVLVAEGQTATVVAVIKRN